jgi:PAS domain S-box-containing protein
VNDSQSSPAIAAFDCMEESVAAYLPDGTFTYVNPTTCKIFANTREALMGNNLWQLFPEAVGNPFHQSFLRVAATGTSETFEHYYTPWKRWYENRVLSAGGWIWVIGSDITERKESAARLETLAHASRVFAEAATNGAQAFQVIARHIAEAVGDLCSIRLLTEDKLRFESPIGLWDTDEACRKLLQDVPVAQSSDPVAAEVLRTSNTVVLSNLDPRAVAERLAPPNRKGLIRDLGIHSAVVVPLKGDAGVLGIMTVARRLSGTKSGFSDADQQLVEELAARASLVVKQWQTLQVAEAAVERLRVITDTLPVLVSLVDKHQRYRFVNATYQTWFGHAPESLLGKSLKEVLGAQAHAVLSPYVNSALAGNVVTFETSVPYADGGKRYIRATNTPYKVNGEVQGYVALVSDITAIRENQLQLQRWEQIFRHAGWGVAVVEPATDRLLAVNQAFASMHGYTVEELVGKPLLATLAPEAVDTFPPDSAPHAIDHREYESVHLRKDGSRFTCLTEISTFRDETGQVVYRAANFQDITERKRYEAELRAAIAIRDEFLSIASHELQTPLTALTLQLDALENALTSSGNTLSQEKLARRVDMATRQTDRLSALVTSLLSVSRITSGTFSLDRKAMDIAALMRELAERFAEHATHVGSALQFDAPPEVHGVWDAAQLDMAVGNLLSNALKYGPGKPVHLNLADSGDRVVITVRDRGIGIAARDTRRVFERFERAVSANHYGGLGLGLYITRQVVEAHGGQIAVESRLGEGSEFTIVLPKRVEALRASGKAPPFNP